MPDNDSQTALRGRPKDPAKREAILDAAKALFIAQGFAGTSMDAVATEAGVSKLTMPTFQYEALNESGKPQRGSVSASNSEEAIALERLMASLAGQDTEMARLFFEAGPQRTLNEMERLLTRARERGLVRLDDPAAAAELFFGMLQSCRHMQLVIGCGEAPSEQEAEAHVREVVRVFLKGYGAAPS